MGFIEAMLGNAGIMACLKIVFNASDMLYL